MKFIFVLFVFTYFISTNCAAQSSYDVSFQEIQKRPKKFLRKLENNRNNPKNNQNFEELVFKKAFAHYKVGQKTKNEKKATIAFNQSIETINKIKVDSVLILKSKLLEGLCHLMTKGHLEKANKVFKQIKSKYPLFTDSYYFEAFSFYYSTGFGLKSKSDTTNYLKVIDDLNLAVLYSTDTIQLTKLAEILMNLGRVIDYPVLELQVKNKLDSYNINYDLRIYYPLRLTDEFLTKDIKNVNQKNIREEIYDIQLSFSDFSSDSTRFKMIPLSKILRNNNIKKLLEIPDSIKINSFTLGIVKYIRCIKSFNNRTMTFDCHKNINLSSDSEFLTPEMTTVLNNLNHKDRRIYIESIKIENYKSEYLPPAIGQVIIKK